MALKVQSQHQHHLLIRPSDYLVAHTPIINNQLSRLLPRIVTSADSRTPEPNCTASSSSASSSSSVSSIGSGSCSPSPATTNGTNETHWAPGNDLDLSKPPIHRSHHGHHHHLHKKLMATNNGMRRKKANRACGHCQKAHLTCDDGRPCLRCEKRGLGDSCEDGVRKKAKYLSDYDDSLLIRRRATDNLKPKMMDTGCPMPPSAHPIITMDGVQDNIPGNPTGWTGGMDLWNETVVREIVEGQEQWKKVDNDQVAIDNLWLTTIGGTDAEHQPHQPSPTEFSSWSHLGSGIDLGWIPQQMSELESQTFDLNFNPNHTTSWSEDPFLFTGFATNNQTPTMASFATLHQQQGSLPPNEVGLEEWFIEGFSKVHQTPPVAKSQELMFLVDPKGKGKDEDSSQLVKEFRERVKRRMEIKKLTMKIDREDEELISRMARRSVVELERIIRLSGTPILVWNLMGEVLTVGDEFCLLTGWRKEELVGKQIGQVFAQRSLEEYFKEFESNGFEGKVDEVAMKSFEINHPLNHHQFSIKRSRCSSVDQSSTDGIQEERNITCSFCFKIKRDMFDSPFMIIGNFLPILTR